MGVGPTRHDVPYGPCRHGLCAWPTAQARPAGPFFVPGRLEKHDPFSVPGQPEAHDELRAARERGKGRKRERAAGDRGVGAELVAGSGIGAELGASALVPAAAEAGLWEAMAAPDGQV